jgi:hypothetical protein
MPLITYSNTDEIADRLVEAHADRTASV